MDGELCSTPSEIEQYYARQLFGPYKGLAVRDVEMSAPRGGTADVAIMNMSWKVEGFKTPKGKPLDPVRVRASFTLRKGDDGWRYVAARFMAPFTPPQ
jgi:hypothetical protein